MRSVFISYRRASTPGEARALFNDLVARLGENSVFMDVQSIALGRDFRDVLQEVTASCHLMLVLIGPNWADAKDKRGRIRLEDPDDFVRLEIEAALKRNIPITPVLVRGAHMPVPEQLPVEIRNLVYRQSFELSHSLWESDVQEMIRRLGLYVPPGEIPSGERRLGKLLKSNVQRRRVLVLIAGVGFIGTGVLVWWLTHEAPPTKEEITNEVQRRIAQIPPIPLDFSCNMTLSVSSRAIDRRYVEHDIDDLLDIQLSSDPESQKQKPKSNLLFPTKQQLFYEWNASVSSTMPVADVTIEIENVQPNDVFITSPEAKAVSSLIPKWFSFKEPWQRNPDYAAKTFTFGLITKNKSATISVRRGLSDPLLVDSDVFRVGKISSTACNITPAKGDPRIEAHRVSYEASALAKNRTGPNDPPDGLPIINDLDAISPNRFRLASELSCEDNECHTLRIENSTVRLGQSLENLKKLILMRLFLMRGGLTPVT